MKVFNDQDLGKGDSYYAAAMMKRKEAKLEIPSLKKGDCRKTDVENLKCCDSI